MTDRISSLIITDFEEDSLTVIDSIHDDILLFLSTYADGNGSVEGETEVDDDSTTEYDSESLWSRSEASDFDFEFTQAPRERPPTRGDRTTHADINRNIDDLPTLPNFHRSEDIEPYSGNYWNLPHS
ncbi:unnamed protein product [Kluyveromyces dobzhanskii CBS 2104]|uniref:WGS project CCBQ000000000 data, contig 00006 n=1 Tax=Kluyveromyces dobzhanskii CBS 2104 TaxID=1427455 RepID=A0A0A8LAJ1_9SACH|nr:unnamed protein product [Kluyveromyces dobzhanskii CBS 2104]